LNDALASVEIMVYEDVVYATSDSGHTEPYLETYLASSNSQITWSGSNFNVRTRDSYSMNNHPVVEVSWYGAKAFCDFYGYRLPTEEEWQAVADYNGSYTYGCGTTIDNSKANYNFNNPVGLTSSPYTSPVNHFHAYGYGMHDMAGNVWEWTTSTYSTYHVFRGGGLSSLAGNCTVSYKNYGEMYETSRDIGFRVCRDE